MKTEKVSLNCALSDTFFAYKPIKNDFFYNRFDYSIIFYARQPHHFAFSGMKC